MRVYLISLVCVLSLALSGCGTSQTPAAESPDLPPLNPQEIPTQQLPDSPTQGDATQMNPSLPALQKLIEQAQADLAQRLSVSISDISLVDAKEVTWPDGSLGCPQPGMFYTQVLTPGYLIELKYDIRHFEYHAGKAGSLTYCENPLPPFEGVPGNT
jgi:hypothetical protein